MRQALRKQPMPLLIVVCGTAAIVAAACVATGDARVSGLWIAAILASLGILENGARRSVMRWGREAQTISCEELAVVAAPLVASPAAIVISVCVAGVVTNLLLRRPVIKAVWNVASLTLQALLAMVAFVALGGAQDGSTRSLFAALAAAGVFLVVNVSLFSLLLNKLGAGPLRETLAGTVRGEAAHTVGIISIGALGALALSRDAWTLPFVLLAVVAFERGLDGYIRARENHNRVESLLASSSDGIFALDGNGRITSWNPAMELLLAIGASSAVGAPLRTIAADVLTDEQLDLLLDAGTEPVELAGVVDSLGDSRTLRFARSPIPGRGTIVTVSDSTALVSSLEAMRANRDRLGLALKSSGAALWEWDPVEGRFTWSENLAVAGVVGVGPQAFAAGLGLLPEDVSRAERANDAAVETGEPYEIEVRAAGPDGTPRWLRLRADVIRRNGTTLLRGLTQDISETRRREQERRELAKATRIASSQAADAEQRLQRMLEQMNDGFYAIDRDWKFVYVNDRGARLLGSTPEELIGGSSAAYERFGRRFAEACREAMEHRVVTHVEDEALEPGRWFALTVHPAPEGIWLFTRETTEERHLEDQLRHAQKMDAVGRLAGGIAHDFNNLLTVINGYSSLALARATEVDALLARRVEQVLAAGQRAATLTSQLLAFSRQQVLQTRVVDLNATIADVEGMLRRLIGPKITIETSLHAHLHEVKADPGGLEQVLMNLCVNARDAINGDSGTITIQTANRTYEPGDALPDPDLRPGDYVVVSVGDTGTGIPEDILPRIFEPFFTTKPAGSGTGLGLATAYGIVKQSGGALTVSSGSAGTVFTVLLPRTFERVVANVPEDDQAPAGGGETILLVEDEPVVRGLARELLTSFGYRVVDVESAEAALAVSGDYDLLVSDVVMPGRNGVELASELTAARPGLRVLLMSGHSTDDMRLLDGNRRWRYLSKPFTPHDLAWTVRALLDAPPDTDSKSVLASPSLV